MLHLGVAQVPVDSSSIASRYRRQRFRLRILQAPGMRIRLDCVSHVGFREPTPSAV